MPDDFHNHERLLATLPPDPTVSRNGTHGPLGNLRGRFGLTRREARVAILSAFSRSSRFIPALRPEQNSAQLESHEARVLLLNST